MDIYTHTYIKITHHTCAWATHLQRKISSTNDDVCQKMTKKEPKLRVPPP